MYKVDIYTGMRGLPVNVSVNRAISLTMKKNIQECKRIRRLYLFCKLNRAVYCGKILVEELDMLRFHDCIDVINVTDLY